MDIIHARSKRRCTLYPGQLEKAKVAKNKTQPVKVIKHFELKSKPIKQAAPQDRKELPYFVIQEEDEDLEVVSASVPFKPKRYSTEQPSSSTSISVKANPEDLFYKKILTPEKFSSEIPIKPIHTPRFNKKETRITKTLNKRSSSLASSSSNTGSECRDSFKKPRSINKAKLSKKTTRVDNHNDNDKNNVVNSKKDVGKLTKQLKVAESNAIINNQQNLPLASTGSNQNQYISASIRPGYAIVTESYIRNLKDEIESARAKPPNEIIRTADQLKAEINQFRNSNKDTDLTPQKVHSTNTNVKITLPKNKFPNTLDLHITNSIHGESFLHHKKDTKEEYISCPPLLGISSEKAAITNSNFQDEKKQTSQGILNNKDVETIRYPLKSNELLEVHSQFRENIQTQMVQPDLLNDVQSNDVLFQNSFAKKNIDCFIHTELVFALPGNEDEKEKVSQSPDSEFLTTISEPSKNEDKGRQDCECKVNERLNSPVPAVEEKASKSSNKSHCQEMGDNISHVSFKEEEIIRIEPEQSPVLPIIVNAAFSSLSVSSSTRSCDSERSIERAYPKEIFSENKSVEDQKHYAKLMKEQNQNIKTFCNLLGEAQVAMLEIAKKFKDTPSSQNMECKTISLDKFGKTGQLGSVKQLSNNEQISENEQEVKVLSEADEQCCSADICTQVNYENDNYFKKKEILSNITTSEADQTIGNAFIISAGENDSSNDEATVIEQEVDVYDFTESPYHDVYSLNQKSKIHGYYTERDKPQTTRDPDLFAISERTENSTSEEEISNIANKKQAEPKTSKAVCSKAFKPTLDTNNICTKGVKSLKDTATEVVVKSIVSQMGVEIKSVKSDPSGKDQEKEQLGVVNDIKIDSKNIEISIKNKLSIQMMPSIDIRRGLVTQTIPTIVITPTESMPQQNVLQDNNIAYEIVKHLSSEIINKTVEPARVNSNYETDSKKANSAVPLRQSYGDKVIAAESCNKPQTHAISGIQKSRTSSKISTKVQTSDTERKNILTPPVIDKVPETESYHFEKFKENWHEVSTDTLNSDKSSVPTVDHVMFHKTNPQKPPDDVRTAVKATLKLGMPVTTFINTCFKPESESEVLIVNNDTDLKINPDISNTTRRSTIVEFIGKKECAKKFINKMIEDPHTEVIFKSYQVLQDQSGHDPEAEYDTDLSFIDTDVYKTYVNPEGFKNAEHRRSEISGGGVSHDQKANNFFTLSVITPPEFYSTKSTQCDEIVGNIAEDNIAENKTANDDNKADNISQSTYIWNYDDATSQCSSIFKNFDSRIQKFPKRECSIQSDARKIVQDPNYVSRYSNVLSQSLSLTPRVSTRHSHSNIPQDIQKRLSAVSAVSSVHRNSNQRNLNQQYSNQRNSFPNRKFSQPSRIVDIFSSHSLKRLSENSNQLRGSRSMPSSPSPYRTENNSENTSIKSENTEDVIFQIDRETLRSNTHHSKVDLDIDQLSNVSFRKESDFASRKDSASSKGDRISVSSSMTSEYVITHDVSLQTSLNDVISIDSKQNLEGGIAKLKAIVGEDTRSDADIKNISCCTKLLHGSKKQTPGDAYKKSIAQQPLQIITDNSSIASEIEFELPRSVRVDVPEAEPMYKPQTLSFPERVLRRLSRRPGSPVGSFIEGLTSHNKNEIIIAKNAPPPQNELRVLQEYKSSEIVNAIKHATESWREFDRKKDGVGRTAEISSQTSAENIDIPLSTEDLVQEQGKAQNENNNIKKTHKKNNRQSETDSESSSISKVEAYTIMSVNVEHPGVLEDRFSTQNKEAAKSNVSPLQRNAPGGDEATCGESFELGSDVQFNPRYTKHEGIFPCQNKLRQKQKKISESTSSSEATTWESISENTDGNLSDGEVKCKCSASIGEIHVCPYGKNHKPIQYLKRNPQNLIKHEFGNPDVKIKWKKEFNSNWVAYYVSRSPSPELDNTESVSKSSDSSGIIRK